MLRPALLSLALLPAAAPPPAFAQLGSTRAERAACRPDAFRLCRRHIPDGAAVRDCLIASASRLSPACRQVIETRR